MVDDAASFVALALTSLAQTVEVLPLPANSWAASSTLVSAMGFEK